MTNTKNTYKGIAAAPGITIARAYQYTKKIEKVQDELISDIDEALLNLDEALNKSKKELLKVFSLAVDKLGENRASIFEAQIMILDDPVLIDTIRRRIKEEKRHPEFIVDDEISKYQALMNEAQEAYMKERSHDIEDIKNRIIRNLKKKKWQSRITNDVIVISDYLTPADTVLFARVNVKGYITNFGGLTSHAAIVARSLNIPAIVGLHEATNKIKNNDLLVLDGFHGTVIINPSEKQINYYREKIEQLRIYDEELAELKNEPAVTTDNKEILLQANLDLTEEIALVVQNGAKGIGLVRTEQLFQEYDVFPEEEVQYNIYREIAEKVYPEKVIIRTLDVGGDKVLPVDVKEPNPFLGWRGIRFLLDNMDLFKTQIRAILRGSEHKNLKMMIPMVCSIKEVRKFKKIVDECKEDLRERGLPFDNDIDLGIMIEVPSAAVMAREYAEEVDFISIGTNDLIQYLLAVDRGNEIVSDLYQEFHPSVVRTIGHIIKEAKNTGKCMVSLCGEMGADTLAVPLLVGLGLDSLSVSASAIPTIKKIIRNLSYEETRALAEKCLTFRTEKEIRNELIQFFDNLQNISVHKIF
ncbi:MAG: phosphoenolpyruvate-protein phosphotransferase [Melioribacteraceae bacterium]|nr:MAG: phosphoenolpyruvate-protein phosphotransferase [Melioribacteraceae bacterium]